MIDPESLDIIDANRAAVSFYGYGEDIRRMKISQINTLTEEQIRHATQKAKGGQQVFYFRHRTASGDIRDVEVYTNPVSIKDKVYIQSAVIDITEKNLAYSQLFDSEQKYRQLFKNMSEAFVYCKKSEEKIKKLSLAVEQSPAAVVITDSEGVIEYVNHKFSSLTGYDCGEAVGKTPRILNSGYYNKEFYSEMWRIIKSGGEWRGEFRNKKKDGCLYWESASITPIVSDNGAITHFVALKEDISVRKTIEEELKKSKEDAVRARLAAEDASEAKSRFLANMSHEIRTPMNSIIGFTDMLASTGLTAEQKELLDYVKTSSGALLSLINDILDLSKIEAGKLEIENAEFELHSMLEQVIGITRANASKKGIKYSYMLDSAINFKVFSDASRLRQVMLNLVDNSIKFTETGKSVKIFISLESSGEDNAVVKFMVSDEGIGILENKLDTIFMSFMQSDTSITRKYGGTGLGLTISNHIINLMGGDGIKVTSVEGSGSDFYFTLNLKKGSSINYEGFKYSASDNLEGASTQKYDILLVEDNLSNIALTTKVLLRFGHNVAVAVNGEEAVEMSERQKYDLLLMDIQMPVMDGFEATKAIRGRGDAVPIIAMTASAMKGDYEACIDAGMDGYIPKPINICEINKTIGDVLFRVKNKNKNNKEEAPPKKAGGNPGALPDMRGESIEVKAAAIEKKMQPAPEGELKVFDPQKLMFNMGDIKELAIDSVDMFLEYSTAYYQEVKKTIEEKNADQIKRAAHKFKGTSLNACAMKVAAVLLKIEGCAKNGEVKECEILFEALGREIEVYKNEVSVSDFFIDKDK
jgi:PAS domain S-box-containing protein